MEISSLIFNVLILFIMMVPGIILKKCKLCSDSFGKGISNLVLYIAQPSLIVYAYLNCESKFADIWQNVLMVFILSIILHIVFAIASMLLFKGAEEEKRKMLRFASIFSNAAFMGIPLIEAILGTEAAIYASIYNITYNAFLWTLGVHICTHKEGIDMDGDGMYTLRDKHLSAIKHTKAAASFLRLILHPVTLASVIGFTLLATGVNAEALGQVNLSIISDSLGMLKGLVAPLAMLVIGLRLAEIDLKNFFNDKYMYLFLALRHILLPFGILGIIYILKLISVPISNVAMLVTLIMAAAPAASSATMFAEKYDCDAKYVSRLVAVSTLLCILTMPLVIMAAELI